MAVTERAPERVALIYVGDGSYVTGVPTTDLIVAADEALRLVETGLYAYAPEPVKTVVCGEEGPPA